MQVEAHQPARGQGHPPASARTPSRVSAAQQARGSSLRPARHEVWVRDMVESSSSSWNWVWWLGCDCSHVKVGHVSWPRVGHVARPCCWQGAWGKSQVQSPVAHWVSSITGAYVASTPGNGVDISLKGGRYAASGPLPLTRMSRCCRQAKFANLLAAA